MKNNSSKPIDDRLIGAGSTSVCSTIADQMLRKSGQAIKIGEKAIRK